MKKQDILPATGNPLFRLHGEEAEDIIVDLDGEPLAACARDTVASLLLRHVDPAQYRHSAVTGQARAPLCMMGVCFECLVEIDGQTNQQGCLVRVRPGMRIRRQMSEGKRS